MSVPTTTARVRNPLTWLLLQPIHFYRRFVSPALPPTCRYAPTCSAYAVEALSVHGPLKGLLLATWRLLRCNPWSLGGVDHVPERGRWRPSAWVPPSDWAGNDETVEVPLPMGMDAPEQGPSPTPDPTAVCGGRSHEGGHALVHDHPAAAGRTADARRVPTI